MEGGELGASHARGRWEKGGVLWGSALGTLAVVPLVP